MMLLAILLVRLPNPFLTRCVVGLLLFTEYVDSRRLEFTLGPTSQLVDLLSRLFVLFWVLNFLALEVN